MHCDIDCAGFVHCSVLVCNFRLRKHSENFDLSKMYWQHAVYAFVLMLKQYSYQSALARFNDTQIKTMHKHSFELSDSCIGAIFQQTFFSTCDFFLCTMILNRNTLLTKDNACSSSWNCWIYAYIAFSSLQRQSIKFNSVAFRTENNHKHFNWKQ